jgi:hypothetical protein
MHSGTAYVRRAINAIDRYSITSSTRGINSRPTVESPSQAFPSGPDSEQKGRANLSAPTRKR